ENVFACLFDQAFHNDDILLAELLLPYLDKKHCCWDEFSVFDGPPFVPTRIVPFLIEQSLLFRNQIMSIPRLKWFVNQFLPFLSLDDPYNTFDLIVRSMPKWLSKPPFFTLRYLS